MKSPPKKFSLALPCLLAATLWAPGDLMAAAIVTDSIIETTLTKKNRGLFCSKEDTEVSPAEIAIHLFENAGFNVLNPRNHEEEFLEKFAFESEKPQDSALQVLKRIASDSEVESLFENESNKESLKTLLALLEKLRNQINDLEDFLDWEHSETPHYTVTEGTSGDGTDFAIKYLTGETQIQCVSAPPAVKTASTFRLAIRDKPEDLTVEKKSSRFKKLPNAGLTFEDNKGANKSSLSANVTLGITLGKKTNAPIAFAQFNSSKSKQLVETVPEGGGDPVQELKIKQTAVFSPGLLWVDNMPEFLDPFFSGGKWGGLAKVSFDLEHDAETLLGRIWLDPILGGDNNICGRQKDVFDLPFWYNCRVNLFMELAHILDAGTHPTLLTQDKSEYLGFGGDLTLVLSLKGEGTLPKRIFIRGRGRYLGVVSGKLSDQKRYEATFGYILNDKNNLTLELSYIKGENITSYLKEDKVAFKLGAKF